MRASASFGIPRTVQKLAVACVALGAFAAHGQMVGWDNLARLTPGTTRAANALWVETPLTAQFKTSKRVVVADLKGPAIITMIHFAMPQALKLNRDVLLRMFWDGETSPSVDVPLVDFFCDPAGLREEVNTALVNKRRGFNAYFPMPFRKSARIELVYDGPVEPGDALWKIMPCYSYVIYRAPEKISRNTAYFHASWRQEGLLLGKKDYVALEAAGQGKFVGWNVTVRRLEGLGRYPVDENAKFFVDGEAAPSVELMGLEDAFGFSYGFPPGECQFPLTGCFPFLNGEAAYRFFIPDAIGFKKSLRLTIDFGVHEQPGFRQRFSKPGNTLEFASTVYWYQLEPHAPLPEVPPAAQRAPAAPVSREKEKLPAISELKSRGVKLLMLCGRQEKEVIFAEPGFGAVAKQGYAWGGWDLPVYHARAGNEEVEIELTVPGNAAGTVRVYVVDPDNFQGGRKQTVRIAGESLGTVEKFAAGRWLEQRVSANQTTEGKVLVGAANARKGSNAVVSIIEWVE